MELPLNRPVPFTRRAQYFVLRADLRSIAAGWLMQNELVHPHLIQVTASVLRSLRAFFNIRRLLSYLIKLQNHGERHMSKVVAFLKNESGATAIEYGLIAAGISVVIIATVNAIGTNLNGKFQSISTQLK
jgi:pilus assembly protein Flp/PilA